MRPPRSDENPRLRSAADEPESPAERAGDAGELVGGELYGELRRVAAGALGRERRHHTLQPTALVHEAYLRLAGQRAEWQNRGHFLGVAAQAMRRVLVDHARRRAAAKRPDPRARVTLSGLALPGGAVDVDVLDLETALARLGELDPRAARVVELRGFAGCSAAEAAEVLGVSEATVARDWRMAQSWLRRELGGAAAGGEGSAAGGSEGGETAAGEPPREPES